MSEHKVTKFGEPPAATPNIPYVEVALDYPF